MGNFMYRDVLFIQHQDLILTLLPILAGLLLQLNKVYYTLMVQQRVCMLVLG